MEPSVQKTHASKDSGMLSLHRLASAVISGGLKGHFGQWAEDVLVRKFFSKDKVTGTYLDIGAYHPFKLSNTAHLWIMGWSGINIDANPNTIRLFNKYRPSDKNIWTAVIPNEHYENGLHQVSLMLPQESDYPSGIVAKGTVNNSMGSQRGFIKSSQVPAISIPALIQKENIKNVDYLNIDIEGFDDIILQEINFSEITPTVVTIEDYSKNFEDLIVSKISQLMNKNAYQLAARVGPTSIFIK
jgi:FkbM family methyltransferase